MYQLLSPQEHARSRNAFVKAIFRILTVLLWIYSPAYAEMEKIAHDCDQGICFAWWPIIHELSGWHQDKEASLNYGFNAIVQDGLQFTDAEVVMYVIAPYKPRIPEDKTLTEHIENDRKSFLEDIPDLQIVETESVLTKDGQRLRSFLFLPRTRGQWERVSYGEEGDFYISFVVSSRTKNGMDETMKDYLRLIGQYQAISNPPPRRDALPQGGSRP